MEDSVLVNKGVDDSKSVIKHEYSVTHYIIKIRGNGRTKKV